MNFKTFGGIIRNFIFLKRQHPLSYKNYVFVSRIKCLCQLLEGTTPSSL